MATHDLTESEREFLSRHQLAEEDVFDWRGLKASERYSAIKSSGKTLALGAPCKSDGHRLRTRAGHCVQCDPSKLVYQSRKSTAAILYALESKRSGLVKIGITEDLNRRRDAINRDGLGGLSDWEILIALEISSAGASESAIHRHLSPHAENFSYFKGAHEQQSREVFRCPREQVIEAFLQHVKPSQIVPDGYQFRPETTKLKN